MELGDDRRAAAICSATDAASRSADDPALQAHKHPYLDLGPFLRKGPILCSRVARIFTSCQKCARKVLTFARLCFIISISWYASRGSTDKVGGVWRLTLTKTNSGLKQTNVPQGGRVTAQKTGRKVGFVLWGKCVIIGP